MKWYSSHPYWMSFEELIELEVEDRCNYELEELVEILKKTSFKYDKAIYKWITPNPNRAFSYTVNADEIESVLKRELLEEELGSLTIIHDAIVVDGIEDGDEGFLIIAWEDK